MWEGVYGGGVEAAGDASKGIVLGSAGEDDETFRRFVGPDGSAVREDW